MRFLAPLLTILLLGSAALAGQGPVAAGPVVSVPVAAALEDGPYVLWDGPRARVLRVRQGQLETTELGPDRRLVLDGLPALTLESAPPVPAPAVFPRPQRLAAVSDVHGNLTGLIKLLTAQGLLAGDRRWAFGAGHLVVLGDTLDRGPQATEALWFLRSLQAQARAAGGRVHVLLGNHEVMVLRGDLAYLHPKYRALRKVLGQDQTSLYGPQSEQGRWLRSLPVVVALGDLLFVHGGLSPALARAGSSLEVLNAQFRKDLDGSGRSPLLGPEGPIWYRGLLNGQGHRAEATDLEVTAILAAFHATTLVVGHTTVDRITAFRQGRVLAVDAGLHLGKPGELLLWDNGTLYRGLADGNRLPLIPR